MTAPRLSTAAVSLSTAAVLLGTLFAVPAAAAPDPAIDTRPVAPPTTASRPAPAQASSRFVVKFKTGAPGAATARAKAFGQAARIAGVSVKELRATATGATVVQTAENLTPGESAGVLASLRSQANVDYAEPDTFVRPASTPNDPLYPEQWDLFEAAAGMRVPAAWDLTTGAGTVVAVIDTGITPHSDLTQVVPGYDFISDATISNDGDGRDSDATDAGDYCNGAPSSWHGTHVAGTIAAAANNGLGIAGVAYSSKILPIRALGACGGYLSDIADAVVWAAGGAVTGVPASIYHPKVINMSLGGAGECSAYFQSALDFAAAQGVAVVAAAGNADSPASGTTPANCKNIITVGATGREGNKASYSNYGPEVDVSAPGGDSSTGANTILSTWNTGTTVQGSETYGYMQGTSMAAPHVAGVAALMMTANPNLTPAQVEETLKQTARPLPGSCDTGGCGAGLVDAGAAVQAAMPGGQPMPEPAVAGAPSVQGEAKVGSALTADPGTWTPGPVTFTYEWLRNDSPIANAAGNSYIPDPADAGASLKVRVTASGASFNGVVATSAATAPVAEGTQAGPSPVINGTAAVGRTLTANPGSWAPGTTLSFQWYRSGVASLAATGSTYTVGAADLGHALTVSATGTRDGYAPLTVGSTPTPAVVPGTLTAPIPLIGGTRKVGYTLTAAPGAWSAGTALKYQWYRSGVAISGATASRYTLGAYDQGKTMRVRVTGTRVGYTTLSKDSASTTAVATGSLTAGTPWISGYPRAGYTLTANPGAWTAGSTLRYQWYRSGVAIAGATAKTYRLVAADRYDTIKFRVVGSKAGYNTVTKYSGPSIRIP